MTTYAARLERAFMPATPCGQVSDGVACDTLRKGVEKLCPDCNPWRPNHSDETQALKADAERYRWFSGNVVSGDFDLLEKAFAAFADKTTCTQAEFDAAIDAMKAKP